MVYQAKQVDAHALRLGCHHLQNPVGKLMRLPAHHRTYFEDERYCTGRRNTTGRRPVKIRLEHVIGQPSHT